MHQEWLVNLLKLGRMVPGKRKPKIWTQRTRITSSFTWGSVADCRTVAGERPRTRAWSYSTPRTGGTRGNCSGIWSPRSSGNQSKFIIHVFVGTDNNIFFRKQSTLPFIWSIVFLFFSNISDLLECMQCFYMYLNLFCEFFLPKNKL